MVKKLNPSELDPVKREAEVEAPIAIGYESQLFADDDLISHRASVFRRVNRPQKHREPFLKADREWEGGSILYSCVVENEGEYWLYYKAKDWSPPKASRYSATTINLARSQDGLSFHKTPFAEAVFEGTNVVLNDIIDDFTVVKDPDDPDPERRFKLLACRGRKWRDGLTPAWSPDGLRWTWGPDHSVRFFGDRCSYWYDPVNRKHIAWSRDMQLYRKRVVVHSESEDFQTWSHPWMAMMPDRLDHPETQFYGGYGFWYRSMYFAYLEIYHAAHQRLDTELACSRDGRTWTRLCDHAVFLPNGEHGEFDAYWVVPTFNPPVLKDGKLLIHYGGRPDPHKQGGFSHVPPGMGGALALSELREDGFVSLDATGQEGIVETKRLMPAGTRRTLCVNVCPFNTRPGYDPMRVIVEMLDEGGRTLEAYGIDPADVIWHRIALEGRLQETVRLRFRLKNARLYSFRFES